VDDVVGPGGTSLWVDQSYSIITVLRVKQVVEGIDPYPQTRLGQAAAQENRLRRSPKRKQIQPIRGFLTTKKQPTSAKKTTRTNTIPFKSSQNCLRCNGHESITSRNAEDTFLIPRPIILCRGITNMISNTLKASVLASCLLTLVANAQPTTSTTPPGTGPNPYTDCGIGAALFPEVNWAAVTSNVIWDLGVTALTSATLSPQTCQGKKIKAALFIRDTYTQLAEETSKGSGEHVTAALDMFQCGTAGRSEAIKQVRAEFGSAVNSPNYSTQTHLDKAGQLYNILEKASERCSA